MGHISIAHQTAQHEETYGFRERVVGLSREVKHVIEAFLGSTVRCRQRERFGACCCSNKRTAR